MPGSKVRIWKQDPSVVSIGIRTAYIPTEVDGGPQDSDILIQGVPLVLANADNDFLFDPLENPIEFDAVHTFTVVRQVLTMYRRAFNRNGITQNFNWQWGPGTIQVYPRAGQDANAYYSRGDRALRFFYFHQELNQTLPLIYTCRSFDIVAHETGHAVLDSLKPGFWDSWHPQTGGLHESFGDLTAIFTMLAQMDQCEAIIAKSKGDLHNKSFFPALAEQFGEALGRPAGLRNADNDLKLSDVGNEVHDLSTVFTGAIYDILADIYVDYQKPDQFDQSETLFRIGKYITAVVLLSIFKAPDQNATYKDIAQNMIDITVRENWKEIIRQQFTKREILGSTTSLSAVDVKEVTWDKCCGTMTHHEHIKDFKKAFNAK